MAAPRKYPEELRQRAIRLVLEAREQDASLSLNAAVTRIATRVGVNADTLRGWCKQAETDSPEETQPGGSKMLGGWGMPARMSAIFRPPWMLGMKPTPLQPRL